MSTLNLAALNSATKYPSIPTYHALGDRGGLVEDAVEFGDHEVVLTEKVDGTNGRIIQLPGGDWIIGSREELLTAKGDRIHNPTLGIVDALRDLADRLPPTSQDVNVLYLEVYGHRIGAAGKQYTTTGKVGHRLFDVSTVPEHMLTVPAAELSMWREHGGQVFAGEDRLVEFAATADIPLVPRLVRANHDDGPLPLDIERMHGFLGRMLPATRVALDDGLSGSSEGIVLRSNDRSVIAKARFQDYERTLKRRAR